MSKFVLSQNSFRKLIGVHKDLSSVVRLAIYITPIDFCVIDGVRTLDRQKELLEQGKTQILSSRHLSGNAVDLAAWVDGDISWDFSYYEIIAKAMKQAANKLETPIIWGGDWETFKDGVHFELPKSIYPSMRKRN